MNNKEQEKKERQLKSLRQNKAYRKMIREISYKDAGEVWRKNVEWLIQGRVEIEGGAPNNKSTQ